MVQQRFGESSVVVIDICRPHGIWLDHGELRQILEYVHSGGAVAQDLEVRQQLRAEAQRMRILNTNMNTDDEHQNAGSFLSLVEGFLGLFDK
jgi:Zn-finger nucleic acid-binding protein